MWSSNVKKQSICHHSWPCLVCPHGVLNCPRCCRPLHGSQQINQQWSLLTLRWDWWHLFYKSLLTYFFMTRKRVRLLPKPAGFSLAGSTSGYSSCAPGSNGTSAVKARDTLITLGCADTLLGRTPKYLNIQRSQPLSIRPTPCFRPAGLGIDENKKTWRL